jgi:hypothetical protein
MVENVRSVVRSGCAPATEDVLVMLNPAIENADDADDATSSIMVRTSARTAPIRNALVALLHEDRTRVP